MAKKPTTVKAYARRFCTQCGTYNMLYATVDGRPIGMCDCGNTDWCDNKTEADVKAQIGKDKFMRPCDLEIDLY